jgi:hypothetical protein
LLHDHHWRLPDFHDEVKMRYLWKGSLAIVIGLPILLPAQQACGRVMGKRDSTAMVDIGVTLLRDSSSALCSELTAPQTLV